MFPCFRPVRPARTERYVCAFVIDVFRTGQTRWICATNMRLRNRCCLKPRLRHTSMTSTTREGVLNTKRSDMGQNFVVIFVVIFVFVLDISQNHVESKTSLSLSFSFSYWIFSQNRVEYRAVARTRYAPYNLSLLNE